MLLLEGKANFTGCGTVTMPSAEAMAQADPDIIQRFQAITKIDLHYDQYRESHENNLAGELALIPPPSSSSPPTLHPHHRQHPSFQRHAYYQVGPGQLLAAHWSVVYVGSGGVYYEGGGSRSGGVTRVGVKISSG